MSKIYNFDTIIDRKGTDCIKVDACEEYFGKKDVIPFWIADMDFKTPDFVIEALRKRLDHEILGYPMRPKSFFEATKNWLKRRNNWDCKIEDMYFSPGIVPAINIAIHAFTQPKDAVMIFTPVYHPFIYAIRDNDRTLVQSSLLENKGHYTMNFEDIENKIKENNVKVLIFCSPHNPVGRVWTKEELQQLGELCVKYKVLIISDEIHSDLVFKPNKHIHFASLSDDFACNMLTFIAPSKTFNLAGLFTSVIHSSCPEILSKMKDYIDKLHISGGNLFGNIALEAAYNNGDNWLDQLNVYIEKNCDFVVNYLKSNIPSITTYKPEGTYLMWLDCRKMDLNQEDLTKFWISDARLALNSGDIFGKEGKGFMRLNVACPFSVLEQAMEQLKVAANSRF